MDYNNEKLYHRHNGSVTVKLGNFTHKYLLIVAKTIAKFKKNWPTGDGAYKCVKVRPESYLKASLQAVLEFKVKTKK